MDQRISFVTLAVRDLEASRAFYVDGLGWTPDLHVPGEVLMIKVGETGDAVIVGVVARCGIKRFVTALRIADEVEAARGSAVTGFHDRDGDVMHLLDRLLAIVQQSFIV